METKLTREQSSILSAIENKAFDYLVHQEDYMYYWNQAEELFHDIHLSEEEIEKRIKELQAKLEEDLKNAGIY